MRMNKGEQHKSQNHRHLKQCELLPVCRGQKSFMKYAQLK